jgi:hypothetical protein
MKRKIAILTQKGFLGKGIHEDTQINVFKLNDEKIYEYESVELKSNDKVSFTKLLKLKEISMVYIDTISEELENLLNILGITIKRKEDWGEDQFISQFVFC